MRKQYRVFLSSFFLLAALLIGFPGTGAVFAKAYSRSTSSQKLASSSCQGWTVVRSRNPSSPVNSFGGVVALSASDVWAVGSTETGSLIQQWNGTNWNLVTAPVNGGGLNDMAAISANDIWAVGSSYGTVTEHWNGTSWSLISSPSPGTENYLQGVAAISTSDVWAVGDYYSSSLKYDQTLIEHWNGTNWSIVASPNNGTASNVLNGVAAISSNNVWAVGEYYPNNNSDMKTLIEHWNGTSWSFVTSPKVGSGNFLYGITALSASNIWVVGSSNGGSHPLILHWNGSSWSVVTNSTINGALYGVVALSASNIWAVGNNKNNTLTEQWNGTSWSIVSSPNGADSIENSLHGVAVVPGTSQLWAVGGYVEPPSYAGKTLIESYCQ